MAFSAEVLISREAGGIRFIAMTSAPPIYAGTVEGIRARQHNANILSVTEIFQNRRTALNVLSGKGATDLDNRAVWRQKYLDDAKTVPPDFAEIVQVGKDVIIRMLQNGKYSERLVSGRNPLVCGDGKDECEIIWISVGIIPPHQETVYDRPRIHLFVRTKRLPDVSQARRISALLQERFSTELLSVSFRTDTWFIDDTDYPVIYPFKEDSVPVDLEKIEAGYEVVCVSVGRDTKCR